MGPVNDPKDPRLCAMRHVILNQILPQVEAGLAEGVADPVAA